MSPVDRRDDDEPPGSAPFALSRATPLTTPVVFASPHSGRFYPPSMMALSRLDARSIRLSEDAHVDALIAPAAALGVAVITAVHARAYVDVNRAAGEIEPAMFKGGASGAASDAAGSARVAAGFGCIARVVTPGLDIYAGQLPPGEAERRIAEVWRPWHAALDALVREARAGFGVALLIDWHSMPAAAARGVRGRRAPDVVLGDRFGVACAPAVTALVQREFEARGYVVARNAPYAGGFTTERYGRPEVGRHALQIEVSRALYLDEATLAPTRGLEPLKRDVAHLAARLAHTAPSWR